MKGDITDLAVSSNNALVASSSNDFIIRVVSLSPFYVQFMKHDYLLCLVSASMFLLFCLIDAVAVT